MNQSDYQKWMERAFLYVEAALAMELATPSRVCMSEEYLRSSFVRGLSHSKPEDSSRVSIEGDSPWCDSLCWKDGKSTPGQGRKVQHDVYVTPEIGAANDKGMFCEAKWLKTAKAEEIVRDIWKLVLSRSVDSHGTAFRCYLLVGGEGDAFISTFNTLRNNLVFLNWRDDGASSKPISLSALVKKPIGKKTLKNLLAWGDSHVRTPPTCLRGVRCVRRASWYRTVDGTKWRMGLWELTSWGKGGIKVIDWENHKEALTAT